MFNFIKWPGIKEKYGYLGLNGIMSLDFTVIWYYVSPFLLFRLSVMLFYLCMMQLICNELFFRVFYAIAEVKALRGKISIRVFYVDKLIFFTNFAELFIKH